MVLMQADGSAEWRHRPRLSSSDLGIESLHGVLACADRLPGPETNRRFGVLKRAASPYNSAIQNQFTMGMLRALNRPGRARAVAAGSASPVTVCRIRACSRTSVSCAPGCVRCRPAAHAFGSLGVYT